MRIEDTKLALFLLTRPNNLIGKIIIDAWSNEDSIIAQKNTRYNSLKQFVAHIVTTFHVHDQVE